MADIRVEKKSGGSKWWIWLIAIFVLLLLIWWWIGSSNRDRQPAAAQPGAAVSSQPVGSSNKTITSLGALTSGRLAGMVGRPVNLDRVPVQGLAGDMAFYIGSNSNDRVLVVFDQVPTPGTSREGKVNVDPNSLVNIQGEVRSASQPLPQGVTADIPSGASAYVFAHHVDVAK